MPLSTYAELKDAIGAWNVDRTDLPTADIVALAEARLNRDLRLPTMETEAALTASAGARTVDLPADFLEPVTLFLVRPGSGLSALRFVAADLETSAAPGEPRYWTVDADAMAFERPCDQAYALVLRYVARLGLSDAEPSNWLLANHPDAYLAACNIEAALYQLDQDQALRWSARYEDARESINARESRRGSAAVLGVDPGLRAGGCGRAFDIVSGR